MVTVNLYVKVNTGLEEVDADIYFDDFNDNYINMAKHAGLYKSIWEPNVKSAKSLSILMRPKLGDIFEKYSELEKLISSHGYGTVDRFAEKVEKYIQACEKHPKSLIKVE